MVTGPQKSTVKLLVLVLFINMPPERWLFAAEEEFRCGNKKELFNFKFDPRSIK